MCQEMEYDYNVFSLMYLRVEKKKKKGKQIEKYAYLAWGHNQYVTSISLKIWTYYFTGNAEQEGEWYIPKF